MYITPGWEHMSIFVLESLIFSPAAHFLQDFHFKRPFKKFPNSNPLATYVDLDIK